MNRKLRELYRKTLDEKWILLLRKWHEKPDLIENDKELTQKCSFCYETLDNRGNIQCHECKINPKICCDQGRGGYFANLVIASNYGKYLKKMIKLLKREKFKCLFKKSGKKKRISTSPIVLNRCHSCGKETGMFMVSEWFFGLIKRIHCVECVCKKLERKGK